MKRTGRRASCKPGSPASRLSGFNTPRSLSFDVTAHTERTGLRWRRSVTSSDILSPSDGAIAKNGTTSVLLTDLVLDSAVTIEIVQGDTVLIAFTLRHY